MRMLFCVLAAWLGAWVPAQAEHGRWVGRWMPEKAVVEMVDVEVEDGEPEEEAVPEENFAAVFAVVPEGFLVDPERLLSAAATRDRAEFLRGHAEESEIGLYVYVFGEGVVVPEAAALERVFADRQAAVVLFFLGEPERAGLFLGATLMDDVPEAEQLRALQSSIMQAAGKVAPEEQLEAFLVQMSIRLYWMERMLGEGTPEASSVPVVQVVDATGPTQAFEWPAHWWPWLVAAAILVVVLPVLGWVYRWRARYRLPVIECEPRLGGDHAAGVGGVISFLSVEVPPAAQRDQIAKDPHRR